MFYLKRLGIKHEKHQPFEQSLLENPERQKHPGTEELPSQDPLL